MRNYHHYWDNTDQNYDDGNNGNKMATMASLIASHFDYLKLLINTMKGLEIKITYSLMFDPDDDPDWSKIKTYHTD